MLCVALTSTRRVCKQEYKWSWPETGLLQPFLSIKWLQIAVYMYPASVESGMVATQGCLMCTAVRAATCSCTFEPNVFPSASGCLNNLHVLLFCAAPACSIDYPVKWFVVVVGKPALAGRNPISYEVKHLLQYPQDKVGKTHTRSVLHTGCKFCLNRQVHC